MKNNIGNNPCAGNYAEHAQYWDWGIRGTRTQGGYFAGKRHDRVIYGLLIEEYMEGTK